MEETRAALFARKQMHDTRTRVCAYVPSSTHPFTTHPYPHVPLVPTLHFPTPSHTLPSFTRPLPLATTDAYIVGLAYDEVSFVTHRRG